MSVPELACSLCGDVCKRGVRVECCGAQCCRACGVKRITSTRACWATHCARILSTADLHNDKDLRDAVQSYRKKGVLDQAWRDVLAQKIKVYHEHSVSVSDKVIHGPNSDLMDGKGEPVRKKFVLASKLRGRSWDTFKEEDCFSMRGNKGANRLSRSLDSYRKPRATSADNRHLLDRRKYGGDKAEIRNCFVALSGHNEPEYSQRKGNSSKNIDNAYLNSPVKTEHTVLLDSGIKTEVCTYSDLKSEVIGLDSDVKTEDIVIRTIDTDCQQVSPKTNDNDTPVDNVGYKYDSKFRKTVSEKAEDNVDPEDGSNAIDTGGGSTSRHTPENDDTQAQNLEDNDSIKIVSAQLNEDSSCQRDTKSSESFENISISFPQSKENVKEHIDVSKHLASGASELNVYVPSEGYETATNNVEAKKSSSEPIHDQRNDASLIKDSAHGPSSAQIVTDEFSIFASTSEVNSSLLCDSSEDTHVKQLIVIDENVKNPISLVKKCRVNIEPIHEIIKNELNNASNIDIGCTVSANSIDRSLENKPSVLDIGAESIATYSVTMDESKPTEAANAKTTLKSTSDSSVLEYEGVRKCCVDIKSLKATNIDATDELDLNEGYQPEDKDSDEESIVNDSFDNDGDSDGRISIQENPFCIDAVTRPESDDESDSEVYVRPLNRIEMSKLREAVEAVSENLRRDSGCSFVPTVTSLSQDCDKPTDKNNVEEFSEVSAPESETVSLNSKHDAIRPNEQPTTGSGEASNAVIDEEGIVQHLKEAMPKCNINSSKQCRVDIKSINAFEVNEALERPNYDYISPIETSSESEDPDSSDENSDRGPTIHENPFYNPDENLPINTAVENLPTNGACNFESDGTEEGGRKDSSRNVLLDETDESSHKDESNVQSATTKNCCINIKALSSLEVAEVQLSLARAEDLEPKESLTEDSNLENEVQNMEQIYPASHEDCTEHIYPESNEGCTEHMYQECQEKSRDIMKTSPNDHLVSIQSESITNSTDDSERLIEITVEDNVKDKVQNPTKSHKECLEELLPTKFLGLKSFFQQIQERVINGDQLNETKSLKTPQEIKDEAVTQKNSGTSKNMDVKKYSKCRINLRRIDIDIAKSTLSSNDSMDLINDLISDGLAHSKDGDRINEHPGEPFDDSCKNGPTDSKGRSLYLSSEETNDPNECFDIDDQTNSKDESGEEPFDQTNKLNNKNEVRTESPEVCSVEDLLVDSDDDCGASFVNYGLISPRFNVVNHQSETSICEMQDDRVSIQRSSCVIDQQNIVNADMPDENIKSNKECDSADGLPAELENNSVDLWPKTKKCRVDLEKYTPTETFAVPVVASVRKLVVPDVSNLCATKCQSKEQEISIPHNIPEVESKAPDGDACLTDQIEIQSFNIDLSVKERISDTESVPEAEHCDIDNGKVCDVNIADNNLIGELEIKPKKCKIRLKSIDLEIHGGSIQTTNDVEEPSSAQMEHPESLSNLEDSGAKKNEYLSDNECNSENIESDNLNNRGSQYEENESSKSAKTGDDVLKKSNIVLKKVVQPCRVLLKQVSFTKLEIEKLLPSLREKKNCREVSGLDIRNDEMVLSQSEVSKVNSIFQEERPDNFIKAPPIENECILPTDALKFNQLARESPQEVSPDIFNEDQKVKNIQEITLDSLNEKQKNVQPVVLIPEEGDAGSMHCKIGQKVTICPRVSFVKLRRIDLPQHLIPRTEVIEPTTLQSEDQHAQKNSSPQIKKKRGYKKEEQWFPVKKLKKTDGDDNVQSGDKNDSVLVDVETTLTFKESETISPIKIKVNRKMSGAKRKQKVYRNNKRAIWEFKNKLDPGRNMRVEKLLSKQWYPGPNIKRLGRRAGVQKLEGLPYDELEADTGLDGGYWRKIGYREIKKKKMSYQFADEDSEDVDEKESSPTAEPTENTNAKIAPDNFMEKKPAPKVSRVKKNSIGLKLKNEGETNVEVDLSCINFKPSDKKGEVVRELCETNGDGSVDGLIPILGKVLKEKQYKKRRSSKDGRIPREEIILVKVESSAGLNGGYWDNVGVRGAVKQTLNRQDSVKAPPAKVGKRRHDVPQKVSNQTEMSRDSVKSEQKVKQKQLKLLTKINKDIVNDIIETSVGRAEKEMFLATKRESIRMKRVIKINKDIVNDIIKVAVVKSERIRIAAEKKELTEKKRDERMKKVNKINRDIVQDLIKVVVGRSERARINAEKKELARKKKEEKIKQKRIQQELIKKRRKEQKKERKRIIRELEKRRKSISNKSNEIVNSAGEILPPIADSTIHIIPSEIKKQNKEIVESAVNVLPSEVKLIYAEESESSFSTTSTADYCYPSETLKNVSSLSPRGAATFFDTTSVDIIICDITPESEELNYGLKDGINKDENELKLSNTDANVHWRENINVAPSKKRKLDNECNLNQTKQNKDSSDIGHDSVKIIDLTGEDKSMPNNWWASDDTNMEDTDSCEDIWKETDDILASLINAYSKKDSKLSEPFITPVEEADKVALETEVSETLKDIDQLIENDKAFNLQGNPTETIIETLNTDSETDQDIVNINKFGSVHISNSTTHLQTAPAKFPSPRHVSQNTCDENAVTQNPLAQPIDSLKQDWSSSDDNECITKPRKKIYQKVGREPLVIRTSWGKAYKIPSESNKMKGGKSSLSNNRHLSSKSTKVSSEVLKSVKTAKSPETLSTSPHPAPLIETALEPSKVKSSHVNPSLSNSKGNFMESHSKRPKLEINERSKLPGRKESTKSTKKAGFLFDEAKYEKDNLNERNHVKALQDLTRSLKKDEDLQSQKMLIAQNPFYVKKQPSQSSSKRSIPENSSKSPSEDVVDSKNVASKGPARSLIVQRPVVKPVLKNNEHVATTSTKHMTEFKNRVHGVGGTTRMSGVSKPKSSTSQSARSSEGKQSTLLSDSKRKFNSSLDDLPPEKQAMLRFLDAEYEKILLEQGQFEN